jgi:heptaprenyl diphosphate synthase
MKLTRSPGSKAADILPVLGGLCFFLSAIEFMIPKPLPFIRIGLANLPLILALDILNFPSFLVLVALKITGQALISGALFSYTFVFSLCGTGVSALLMYTLRKIFKKEMLGFTGISAAGALASGGMQLFLAYFLVFGTGVRYATVPVLSLSLVTGTVLGIFCEYFARRSLWYERHSVTHLAGNLAESVEFHGNGLPQTCLSKENVSHSSCEPSREKKHGNERELFIKKTFSSGELAAAGLLMMPALLINPDTGGRVIQFLFFCLLVWLTGKKINPLITFTVIAGIIFFNLLVPYGEILFEAGPLVITGGALQAGVHRAFTLEGLFMLSRCCVSSGLSLPGSFGKAVAGSFRIFALLSNEKPINAGKKDIGKKRNWAEWLDRLLIEKKKKKEPGKEETISLSRHQGKPQGSRIFQKAIIAAVTALAWLPPILAFAKSAVFAFAK